MSTVKKADKSAQPKESTKLNINKVDFKIAIESNVSPETTFGGKHKEIYDAMKSMDEPVEDKKTGQKSYASFAYPNEITSTINNLIMKIHKEGNARYTTKKASETTRRCFRIENEK